jgi:flagellar FliJ protein
MQSIVERPSFTFRLERVRSLRTRAEEQAREALAHELRLRVRGEAILREAAARAAGARTASLETAQGAGASGATLLAAHAWVQRTERDREAAALDLDRRDAEVAARRESLAAAARDREAIDKLAARQKAQFDAEWNVREQHALDEIALGVHRRAEAV